MHPTLLDIPYSHHITDNVHNLQTETLEVEENPIPSEYHQDFHEILSESEFSFDDESAPSPDSFHISVTDSSNMKFVMNDEIRANNRPKAPGVGASRKVNSGNSPNNFCIVNKMFYTF